MKTKNEREFKQELIRIINIFGIEKHSDTPDFLIADYLFDCMISYGIATRKRDDWHQFTPFESRINVIEESDYKKYGPGSK